MKTNKLKGFFKIKNYKLINIVGLAIGIVCVLIIMLWVEDEIQYDSFHENTDQIYRVISEEDDLAGYKNSAMSMPALANSLKEKIPEIEKAANFEMDWEIVTDVDNRFFNEQGLAVVSEDFFDIFSFPCIEGNPKNLHLIQNSVVISENTAHKYFGDNSAVGKHFNLQKKEVEVVAVLKEMDYNSHIRFDMAISGELASNLWGRDANAWGNWCLYTYVLTSKNSDAKAVAKKIPDLLPKDMFGEDIIFLLQPLKNIHFEKHMADEDYTYLGDKKYVYIFSFMGIFILILACVNYINLSIAAAEKNIISKGIRKLLGASKQTLVTESLLRSLFTSIISTIIALGILYVVIPFFNNLTQKNMNFSFSDPIHLLVLLFIPIVAGIISGLYPAFYLIAQSPINLIKKNRTVSGNWQQKGLVTFQFSLSIFLIIATLTSIKQINFIQQKNLGFDKENALYFYMEINDSEYATLKESLLKIPGIESVAGKNYFSSTIMNFSEVKWENNNEGRIFSQNSITEDYFPLLKVNFLEGRNFSPEINGDKESSVIINKRAKEIIGNNNPIGSKLNFWGRQYTIIGVIDEAHFKSLNENVQAEFYTCTSSPEYIFVRYNQNANFSIKQLTNQIDETIHELHPNTPFDIKFLDATYNQLYENDKRVGEIFGIMASLAIFISCLGLLGLTLFAAEKRIKEIGVRKVNGAKISEIILMLSSDFVRWVIMAFIITTPLAWLAMNNWLGNFAYRTNLTWWIFALAGIMALVIALFTISWQSWRAASRNPVEALRYE